MATGKLWEDYSYEGLKFYLRTTVAWPIGLAYDNVCYAMLYCAMVTYMPTGGTSSPFHVPRSSFFVFHSRSLFPVLSFPFPVLSFSNTPLKSTHFCHIWLGMALRASFLAANTKRFVVTSGYFTSSFPGSLFFPSSSFLGKGYCLERFVKCLSFMYYLYPWCLMIAIKFPVIWKKTNYLYLVDYILEASASEEAFDLNLWWFQPFEVTYLLYF